MLGVPLPSIPDSQYVKPESYNYQKSVISGWVCRESDQVETEKIMGTMMFAQRLTG